MRTAATQTGPPIQFYLFAGHGDRGAVDAIERFVPRIRPPHSVTVSIDRAGGHNFHVWQAALPEILAWLGKAFRHSEWRAANRPQQCPVDPAPAGPLALLVDGPGDPGNSLIWLPSLSSLGRRSLPRMG